MAKGGVPCEDFMGLPTLESALLHNPREPPWRPGFALLPFVVAPYTDLRSGIPFLPTLKLNLVGGGARSFSSNCFGPPILGWLSEYADDSLPGEIWFQSGLQKFPL
ncbi:hypothetical protein AMD24_00765 [Candidatus Xiphinematobacter sp. Idaho Grape]|nr:hypothetical protein AMD24_00765 [Candidatus Xiphinematobacter sp. Idaho Grape]